MMTHCTRVACITLEVLFFFGVIILDVVIYELTFLRADGIQPFQRGFVCNNQDISKPYQTERLSFIGILATGVVLSLVMIMITELDKYFSKGTGETNEDRTKVGSTFISTEIIGVVHRMGAFGAGMALLLLICQVIALLTGRLRPHFLAVCKPNRALFNCSQGYITADVCTGNPLLVKRARLSFPSLHTAASVYSLVFVAICLQATVCLTKYTIFRLVLQTLLILLGIATGLSRISCYYHHWTDILAAAVLGVIMATVVAATTMKAQQGINKNKHQDEYSLLQDQQEEEIKSKS